MDFALGHPSAAVPDDLLEWAAGRFLDTVGVALACASFDLGTAGARLVRADPAPGPASVWASGGLRARATDACLANGMLAHGMDYDDTHPATMIHPSVVVAPTALALGEETGATGRDIVAAGVIGYEVAARLGVLAEGRLQKRGFHPTAIIGIFAATAVACRLLGVGRAEAVNAAGLAGSMASGLMEYLSDGSDAKQMHPGWAANAAVTAVRLARCGATGPATVLEGPSGVYRSFAGVDLTPEGASSALDGLGWEWVGTRVAPKPYPAGHCIHAPVDAWRALRERLGLRPSDTGRIRRLTALVPSAYLHLVCDPLETKRAPRTVYDARFSLPFSLALTVVDGGLELDSYRADRLRDQRVLDIARRVDYQVLEYDEYPSAFPGGVRIELDDGTRHEQHVRHNAGSLGNPMSTGDLDAKFLGGARRLADQATSERLLSSLRGLPAAPSASEFTAAMAAISVPSERLPERSSEGLAHPEGDHQRDQPAGDHQEAR